MKDSYFRDSRKGFAGSKLRLFYRLAIGSAIFDCSRLERSTSPIGKRLDSITSPSSPTGVLRFSSAREMNYGTLAREMVA